MLWVVLYCLCQLTRGVEIMTIDFSKAPEGATHYMRTAGPAMLMWYRIYNGGLAVWDDGLWGESIVNPDSPLVKPIPTFEPFVSVEEAPTTGSTHDPVNNPSHYASSSVECIEAIKASMPHEAFLGYLKGNVQKYVFRYEKKVNPVEDLKKAQWYLARLVEEQEGV